MMWRLQTIRLLAALVLALAISGCSLQSNGTPAAEPEPRPGKVEQIDPFLSFVEAHPTPEEFRRVYPDVTLVLPGDIVTQEYRTDRSRFFAELDDEGRIRGGEFR